jgi:anthranilate phosphoribosyltransferase
VTALRNKMLKVEAPAGAMDVVGTGGDNLGSYNISTLTALIVAAAGVPVAKHGNRAASSNSGAADVLTALGVKIGLDATAVSRAIEEAGVGFMFAQTHHASMRHVGPVRVELGTRTLFNLIGPLSNPAGVKRQLLGVFSQSWLEPLVEVLRALGSERVWAVHGSDGLDEMTTTGATTVVALENGTLRRFTVTPDDAGLERSTIDELRGGDPQHNATALRRVLDGERSPYRDIAVLNAAASLVVAEKAANLREGAAIAQKALDSGAAKATLEKLVASTNRA